MSYRTLDTRELYDELTDLRDEREDIDANGLADNVDHDAERLAALETLCDDIGEDTLSDGEPMIREEDFAEYAEELAYDTGMFSSPVPDYSGRTNDISAQWPFTCIDWDRAADDLSHDYTLVTFDGYSYYVRSS